MFYDNCPECGQPVNPPLKSIGRQVCYSCGWSVEINPSEIPDDFPLDYQQKKIIPKNLLRLNKIEMGILSTLILALIGVGGFFISKRDPFICSNGNIKKVTEQMNSIIDKWDAANSLASSSPRIALSMPISKLQDIQQEVKEYEFPKCAENVIQKFIRMTEYNIDVYMFFAANDDATESFSYANMEFKEKVKDVQVSSKIFADYYNRLKNRKTTDDYKVAGENAEEAMEILKKYSE